MSVVKASRLLAVGCPPPTSKSVSLQLLVSNAFIQQAGTGLFSLLPLGQRVVTRLVSLIEKELDGIGAQKISMPFLGAKELWEKSGRWDNMGSELLKMKDRKKKEFCLQPTAEEMVTELVASHSKPSKAAYPLMLYQTTDKFRDEMNPRFGLIRGRSFLMNDLYSFDMTEGESRHTYDTVVQAYDRIFNHRLGLETYKVQADSGVHGGSLSHEYHLKNSLEEDALELCSSCGTYYKADEIVANMKECCEGAKRKRISSIEVAHTFVLGTRYAEALNAYAGGNRLPLHMCCFGIGVSRLIASVIEHLSRAHCTTTPFIHLPKPIQPFDVAVIPSRSLLDSPLVGTLSSSLLDSLWTRNNPNASVLLDDRIDLSIGRRIMYAQSIGLSRVIVMGKETEKTKDKVPQFELWSADPMKSEKLALRGNFDLGSIVDQISQP